MANRIQHLKGDGIVQYKCPGCGSTHIINVDKSYPGPCWGWNGSETKPTLTPSVNYKATQRISDAMAERIMAGEKIEPVKIVCHHFVKEGRIQFLNDCTHALKGQTVDMYELEY